MSENEDITTPVITNNSGGVLNFISQHFILIGGGILVVLYLVFKFKSKSTTTATTTVGDLSGLSTDANGNPIVYRDTADSFYNYSTITDSNNTTLTNTVTDTSTTSIANNPVIQGTPPVTSKPVSQPSKPVTTSKGSWSCNYAVVSGDTLSSIAAKYNTDWHSIYTHNTNTIDTIAHAHGNPIPGGTWNNIFPGEVLVVPCK